MQRIKAGKYAASSGVCQACPIGKFSAAGQSSCTPCPAGQYSDQKGAADECTACPAGYYSEYSSSRITNCTACPAGTYASSTGSSSSQCGGYCAPGRYGDTPGSQKKNCTGPCAIGEEYFNFNFFVLSVFALKERLASSAWFITSCETAEQNNLQNSRAIWHGRGRHNLRVYSCVPRGYLWQPSGLRVRGVHGRLPGVSCELLSFLSSVVLAQLVSIPLPHCSNVCMPIKWTIWQHHGFDHTSLHGTMPPRYVLQNKRATLLPS